jgi:hypothetical protein
MLKRKGKNTLRMRPSILNGMNIAKFFPRNPMDHEDDSENLLQDDTT